MRAGLLGVIAQPGSNSLQGLDGVPWGADNGCFAEAWDPVRWLEWLTANQHHAAACLFAVVPDVVGDHAATLERWHQWGMSVAALGYPLAFALQDGATVDEVPWDECAAVFIGGTTEFKLSPEARALAVEARRRGLHVHMGRVNSLRRLTYAADFCDTADGTYLAFGPDINLPRLLRYLRTTANLAHHQRFAL